MTHCHLELCPGPKLSVEFDDVGLRLGNDIRLTRMALASDDDVRQAQKQLRAADARGVGLKWYYAEEGAANMARLRFKYEGLERIIVGVMPPRQRR